MILRNTADQPILIGPLELVADGSAVTSGAAISVRIGDTAASSGTTTAGAGVLRHVSSGIWVYVPTQAETDTNVLGLILSSAGARSVGLAVSTSRFPAQTPNILPSVAAGTNGGLPLGDNAGRVLLQPAQPGVTIPTVATVTTVTNAVVLPTIPPGWVTGAGIAAGALNGKGDWLTSLGFTYTAPDNAGIANVKAVTDKLNTMLTGSGPYLYTAASLVNAPTGSGGGGGATLAQIQNELDTRGLTFTMSNRIDVNLSSRMASFTYTAPDNAGIASANSALTSLASAVTTVNSNVLTATQYLDTEVAAIKAATDKLDTTLELNGANYRFTVASLYNAPSGGGGGGTGNPTIEGTLTLVDVMKLMLAFVAGTTSGGGSDQVEFYSPITSTKRRLAFTLDDQNNRTLVVRDVT